MSFKDKYLPKIAPKLLTLQQHSPKLLFAAGVVGFGATIVLAVRATMNIDNILETHEATLEKIDQGRELELPNYTEKDAQRDTALLYIRTAVELGKVYGPAIVVGGLSIAALTGSHMVLSNRYTGLSAAYAALNEGYRAYRKNVVTAYGEQVDAEMQYGSEEYEVVDETEEGPVVTAMKRAALDKSPYSVWFDEQSTEWGRHPMSNVAFLRSAQGWANDKLRAYGYVFLNDVHRMLGLSETAAGQVVGWIEQEGADRGTEWIDFGVFKNDKFTAERFIEGEAPAIRLYFNVHGPILDMIDKIRK